MLSQNENLHLQCLLTQQFLQLAILRFQSLIRRPRLGAVQPLATRFQKPPFPAINWVLVDASLTADRRHALPRAQDRQHNGQPFLNAPTLVLAQDDLH